MNDLRHISKRDGAIRGIIANQDSWKDITTVPTRPLDPYKVNDDGAGHGVIAPPKPIPSKPVGDWSVSDESGFSVWQLLQKFPRLVGGFINLLSGLSMKNSTKIATGATTIIVALAAIFGYDLSPELQGVVGTIAALVVGWLVPAPTTPTTTE